MDAQTSSKALFVRGRIAAATLAATALSTVLVPSAGVAAALVAPSAPAQVGAAVHATSALSNSPIVGLSPAYGTAGYWMVSSAGDVFAFGTAHSYGSLTGMRLAKPIVGIASTPTGHGYWLVASDGGIFSFGDAHFFGSTGNLHLAKPIVGMASTATGRGYWLVASDGGIFSFGDATFHGSTGHLALAKPIVGMASTATGRGYWLVASDGGIFTFGDATFHGSTGHFALARPIIGMARTPTGAGYWLVAADGGIFTFGDAPYHGSATAFNALSGAHSVGILPMGAGYWVPNNMGQVDAVDAPAPAGAQTVTSTSSRLPSQSMPSASIAPSGAFQHACWMAPLNVGACDAAALADINAARASEGYGPLGLPSNFESYGSRAQVIIVANAERTSRGLPNLPENAALDNLAQAGAQAGGGQGADPTGPNGYAWGSNIAWGDPTALSADFGWMYDDGPNSENIDCTSASAPGCWGHRENILAPWGGASGAGVYNHNGTIQLTQLFVENY
jgi:uncharacterized protein YkwD